MTGLQKPTRFDQSGVDVNNLQMAQSEPQVTPTPATPPIDDVADHLEGLLSSVKDKLQNLQTSNPAGGMGHQIAVGMLLEHAMNGIILAQAQSLMQGFAATVDEKPTLSGEVPE